jgi:MFS transporter, BCD family, chlorophyll transporter
MMALAGRGKADREGVRMGLWGAAQAIAFGAGGFAGTVAYDLMRRLLSNDASAYAVVFAFEGMLFVVAAVLALRIAQPRLQAPSLFSLLGNEAPTARAGSGD